MAQLKMQYTFFGQKNQKFQKIYKNQTSKKIHYTFIIEPILIFFKFLSINDPPPSKIKNIIYQQTNAQLYREYIFLAKNIKL